MRSGSRPQPLDSVITTQARRRTSLASIWHLANLFSITAIFAAVLSTTAEYLSGVVAAPKKPGELTRIRAWLLAASDRNASRICGPSGRWPLEG